MAADSPSSPAAHASFIDTRGIQINVLSMFDGFSRFDGQHQVFTILKRIYNRQSNSEIYLVSRLGSTQLYAVKIVVLNASVQPRDRTLVNREARVAGLLDHANIAQCYDVYYLAEEAALTLYLLFEYLDGGELLERVINARFTEQDCRIVFHQICLGVAYCHAHNVVHRDLKLENIMFLEHRPKIIDFGFCNLFTSNEYLGTFCGSIQYASPEIVEGQPYFGPKVDMWSLGVILYAMLVGNLPFQFHGDNHELRCQITRGLCTVPDFLTAEVVDLLTGLLNVSQQDRLSIDQALQHPWFINYGFVPPPPTPYELELVPAVVDKTASFLCIQPENVQKAYGAHEDNVKSVYRLLYARYMQLRRQNSTSPRRMSTPSTAVESPLPVSPNSPQIGHQGPYYSQQQQGSHHQHHSHFPVPRRSTPGPQSLDGRTTTTSHDTGTLAHVLSLQNRARSLDASMSPHSPHHRPRSIDATPPSPNPDWRVERIGTSPASMKEVCEEVLRHLKLDNKLEIAGIQENAFNLIFSENVSVNMQLQLVRIRLVLFLGEVRPGLVQFNIGCWSRDYENLKNKINELQFSLCPP